MTPVTAAGWPRRRPQLAAAAGELAERTAGLLGSLPAGADGGPDELEDTLFALTGACLQRLRDGRPNAETTRALRLLVSDLQELADELHHQEAAGLRLRIARCERSLSQLRASTSSAALVDALCDAATTACGLERVVLSRVVDGRLSPWMACAEVREHDWWARAGAIDELPDAEPALLAGGLERLFPDGAWGSHVVAPIHSARTVIGFLHADHDGRRECDETDRDILWTFAVGFGHLYERTALLEDLRRGHAEIREVLADVDRAFEELTEAEVALALHPDPDEPIARSALHAGPAALSLEELTPREREVLEMIVAGARNADIAQRLTIAETTVKSHVKSVLAKLGAVNRSHAIALYMGAAGL